MIAAWFDRVKACVGWDVADQAQVGELRRRLDSDIIDVIEALGEQLARLKGTQTLMANPRFVRHLHDVLREWLMGLLDGTFGEDYVEKRWMFGQRLVELDLTFEDVILVEKFVQKELLELAQRKLEPHSQDLPALTWSLDRALEIDTAMVCSSYLQVHDAELERVLLDRFLSITGFSPTLYGSLLDTRGMGVVDKWSVSGTEPSI